MTADLNAFLARRPPDEDLLSPKVDLWGISPALRLMHQDLGRWFALGDTESGAWWRLVTMTNETGTSLKNGRDLSQHALDWQQGENLVQTVNQSQAGNCCSGLMRTPQSCDCTHLVVLWLIRLSVVTSVFWYKVGLEATHTHTLTGSNLPQQKKRKLEGMVNNLCSWQEDDLSSLQMAWSCSWRGDAMWDPSQGGRPISISSPGLTALCVFMCVWGLNDAAWDFFRLLKLLHLFPELLLLLLHFYASTKSQVY